jgi:dTMP kinase
VDSRVTKDRLESENNEFRRKVHEGYNQLIKKYKKRFIIIDASKSKIEVLQQIIKIIESYI